MHCCCRRTHSEWWANPRVLEMQREGMWLKGMGVQRRMVMVRATTELTPSECGGRSSCRRRRPAYAANRTARVHMP